MDAYFDTAIILKLYVQEATSPEALRLANERPAPYLLTPWQEIEARTALRLKAFRKEIRFDKPLICNEFQNSALRPLALRTFLRSRRYPIGVSAPKAQAFAAAGSRCSPAPLQRCQLGNAG